MHPLISKFINQETVLSGGVLRTNGSVRARANLCLTLKSRPVGASFKAQSWTAIGTKWKKPEFLLPRCVRSRKKPWRIMRCMFSEFYFIYAINLRSSAGPRIGETKINLHLGAFACYLPTSGDLGAKKMPPALLLRGSSQNWGARIPLIRFLG